MTAEGEAERDSRESVELGLLRHNIIIVAVGGPVPAAEGGSCTVNSTHRPREDSARSRGPGASQRGEVTREILCADLGREEGEGEEGGRSVEHG